MQNSSNGTDADVGHLRQTERTNNFVSAVLLVGCLLLKFAGYRRQMVPGRQFVHSSS
jgi:hypothetical protein